MAKTFKCPFCDLKFADKEKLYYHIEKDHPEVLKDGYSAARVYFNFINKKDHGSCVICRKPTEWNEKTRKYMRFCSEECKNEYVKQMKNRMINVYGKVHLLNDPKKQREMLSARSISGEYEFKDGGKHSYTGSYERSFLEFLDKVMEFSSLDVVSPCPFTFYYTYEGKELFYIPDIYIPSLNLIVEIKDGGDNPNTHPKIQAVDKIKEKLKDDLMKKGSYNYIKITNKDNFEFIEFLIELKNKDDEDKKPIIRIAESNMSATPYRGFGPLNESNIEEESQDVRNYPYIAYRLDEEISGFMPTDVMYLQDPLDSMGIHGEDREMKSLYPFDIDNTKAQWVIVTNIYPNEFKDMGTLIDGFLEAISGGSNIVLKRSYKDDKNIRFTWEKMRENYNRLLEQGIDSILEFKADPTETVVEELDHGCKVCKDANGKYYFRDEMGHCTDKANSKEGINFWQRALISLKHRRGDYRKSKSKALKESTSDTRDLKFLSSKDIETIKEYYPTSNVNFKNHDWEMHILPVIREAQRICTKIRYKYNANIEVGCALHDIGLINGKDDHQTIGRELASQLLEKLSIEVDNDRVLEAIEHHRAGDNDIQNCHIEAQIVAAADRLSSDKKAEDFVSDFVNWAVSKDKGLEEIIEKLRKDYGKNGKSYVNPVFKKIHSSLDRDVERLLKDEDFMNKTYTYHYQNKERRS